jgi:hypothetical protein
MIRLNNKKVPINTIQRIWGDKPLFQKRNGNTLWALAWKDTFYPLKNKALFKSIVDTKQNAFNQNY